MDSLLKGLGSNITDDVIERIAASAGMDKNSAKNVLDKAIPEMTKAMAKNTKTQQGAENLASALDGDHDGSIFSNLDIITSGDKMEEGGKILNHLFGQKTDNVLDKISGQSKVDKNSTSKLLTMAAPLVLGTLGKAKNEAGLDAEMLSTALKMASKSKNSGIMGVLDLDNDGKVIDDLPKILAFFGVIKKFLSRK